MSILGQMRWRRPASTCAESDFLLSVPAFERAAAGERMRVDRNGSVLAMLAIAPPKRGAGQPDPLPLLLRVLEGRLRLTDTPGRLKDGRIGVLLPDTGAPGAWKVAADICDVYAPGHPRPECEVLVYPDRRGPDEQNRKEVQDSSGASSLKEPNEPNLIASSMSSDACDRFDRVFARATPAWKRAIDIVGASCGLMLAAPIIGAAALAIRVTTPGEVFFRQEREGLGGRRFRICKLRTMRHDAESYKDRLRRRSTQDGPAFKMRRDPRVTPIGRILRQTSIDELPQLWNVLRGEMSLVGPRPLPVDESLACRPWQRRRLMVTPGITCIWQVHGRSVVRFDEWVRMDLQYAQRYSFWNDLKLLLQTGPAVIFTRGPR
ncbi:UDP-glucose:undecaprenyl-phosphate glucose-1-phosphate transferase [Pirellulimonas nuda]|uniref:UDP-glucose:undecaprenyl-phosphate glucose-1-phosphate transferase n=1 Tax=Pirellulimonas nuda TaxID=2528009 RepID=A0A518DEV1_9BACT|nr:sugar transferase [Pirellulimonas nuda]QDU89999.1 UDP-glucose:undecaprenyl-phosphate glucose-1-phosphate transferase [Pirellulimonas nuda]